MDSIAAGQRNDPECAIYLASPPTFTQFLLTHEFLSVVQQILRVL